MSDDKKPEEPEAVAMNRADEVLVVQDQDSVTTAGKVPAVTDYNTQSLRPMSPRMGKMMFGAAALGLVLIIVAFFWDAFEDAAEKGGRVIRSTGMFRRQIEFLADSQPDGARVFVDGNDRGRTPALLTIECDSGGDMVLKLLKDGFLPHEQKVPCNDRPLKVKVTLTPK